MGVKYKYSKMHLMTVSDETLETRNPRFTEGSSYPQRAKGRTLLKLLQNGRANIDKSASATERAREQQLSRRIVSLNRESQVRNSN
jgi:hypothetical protein